MRGVRAWLLRLSGFAWRERRIREFNEELESHVQMHVDDNIRAGMTASEARRRALVRLGGVEQTKERYRDRLTLPSLESALQDVRGGLRLLWRSPAFTTVAVLTLALGVGANTVMFTIVNTVLLRPLPYTQPERLVAVQALGADGGPAATAPPDFYTYCKQQRTLAGIDAYYTRPYNLTGSNEPERVPTLIVSSGFFDTLGVQPALGRGFTRADETWGAHRVVVLSDALWQGRFGADPLIVGKKVLINGEPFDVVGVLPPAFSFLAIDAQIVVPMAFAEGDGMNSHSNYFLRMFGRLTPDISAASAVQDLNQISDEIARAHPENRGMAVGIVPLQELLVGDVRRPVLVLLGAVGFVLLIACANLANLLLARGAARQREIALRTAVGATRGRLLRQLLTESLVLSAIGGAAGLAVTYFALDSLNLLSRSVLPRATDIRIDLAVLAFTFAATTLTGILFGLVPALRSSAADLNDGLKESARVASAGSGAHRLRAGLVVAELALSLMLLAGAGLMVKSMYRLLKVHGGFSTSGVLTMQINLAPRKYVDADLERRFSPRAYDRSIRFFTELIDRVRSVPGVRAAGATSNLPLAGENWGKFVTLYDRPFPNDITGLPQIQYRVVAGDYFRAIGIRVLNGRPFDDTDRPDTQKVAIVNREFVKRLWDGQDPLGKIISVNPPLELVPAQAIAEAKAAGMPDDYAPDKLTVVGVVDDVHYGGLNQDVRPTVYMPFTQGSEGTTNMFLAVRTAGDPMSVVGAVRDQVRQIDRDQPIANIQTIDQRIAASVMRPRLQATVLGLFAAVALMLAAVGIYGVMSYTVSQRNREIGIRMALGARRQEVLALILRQAGVMVAVGLSLGLAGAFAGTRVVRQLLFDVSPTDPAVFAAVAVVLAASGCLAAYIPARRATKVDPIVTLRYE